MPKDKKKEKKMNYNPFSVGGAIKLAKERDKSIDKKLKKLIGGK